MAIPRPDLRRFGRECHRHRWRPAVVAVLLVAGCGAPGSGQTNSPTPSTAMANATALAAATATAGVVVTANARDVAAFQTAQASLRAPTPTPTPAAVPTATPLPASTPSPMATVATTATVAAYTADFRRWPTRQPEGADPASVRFDAGSDQYVIALTDAHRAYAHWEYAPEGRAFGNFTLSVDARQVAGPPGGTYGVLFRAQPKGPQDKTNAHYYLGIDASKQQVFLIWAAGDNTGHVLAEKTVTAIQQGDAINHLQAQVSGDKITVTVNGTPVGTATGPSAVPGAVGLIVVNPQQPAGAVGEVAAFSHLVVLPIT